MSHEFYSRGKLLITGEYFVLEGSQALAVPLKLGQSLKVNKHYNIKHEINWESYIKKKLWFASTFDLNSLNIIDTTNLHIADYIKKLLQNIKKSCNVLNQSNHSVQIKTNLDFLPEWGMGSSSSLISNLAYWANLNPYKLFFSTFDGSGYDIACARSSGPILYQKVNDPVVQAVAFEPGFSGHIYFVYLGKKQDSQKSIEKNRERIKTMQKDIRTVSQLTKSIVKSKNLREFENYIKEHEEIISKALNEETVQTKHFSSFKGTVKSLGAWGGDFIMATHGGRYDYVKNYFNDKGLKFIFPYKELVL